MSAPMSFFRSLISLRMSFSNTGMTKARVFPDPVTASTMTSLCFRNNGIVALWTGVIRSCPIDSMTSKLKVWITSQARNEPSNTYIHGVNGVGREVQGPAYAVDEEDMMKKC
jgi:hypothetical protein